jgi:LAS superfamily LD-carboxypeptidase LdcB
LFTYHKKNGGVKILDITELVGKKNTKLISIGESEIHKDILEDWLALKESAKIAGFDLSIASAFRSFDRQLQIWNDKVLGKRPVLDASGLSIDIDYLSEEELLFSILKWSALPGTSRHHWGTDLDVYDKSSISNKYEIKLTENEVSNGGVFASFHDWLDGEIKNKRNFDFFRPYERKEMMLFSVLKKPPMISEERWHISHNTISSLYAQKICFDTLFNFFKTRDDILLKKSILKNFENIYENFIKVSIEKN